jgi:UTP:GlnB (protein PII) uridylyltransferase
MTLGERVEDVFLIDGACLQNPRTQIQFETDLLQTLRIDELAPKRLIQHSHSLI